MPGFSTLQKNRDFTLALKIELADSLRLIPRHILLTATLLRKIRNIFAHDISLDCFDQLSDEIKGGLELRCREFYPDDAEHHGEFKDMFAKLSFGVIIGIGIYTSHIRDIREYIETSEFSSNFTAFVKSKSSVD